MASSTPTLDDIAVLNAELAALVRAKIPLEPELRRLGAQLPGGAAALSQRLANRLESGVDLAEAIEQEGAALPESYRAIVAAGLASGNLPSTLESLAVSTRRLADIRRITGVALMEPIAIVVLASLLLLLLVSVLATSFWWIAPPQLVPWQQWLEAPTLRWTLGVAIPVLAILLPLLWWVSTRGAGARVAGGWNLLGWIPGVGRLQRLGAAATLAEVLRAMVESGAPLDRALRVAGHATSDRFYRRVAITLAEQSQQGGDLSHASVQQAMQPLPPLLRTALGQCKHRGLFVSTLAQASRSFQSRAEAQRESLTSYLPAFFTVGVAGTITAAYTIGLMWPYAHMLRTMADGMWK